MRKSNDNVMGITFRKLCAVAVMVAMVMGCMPFVQGDIASAAVKVGVVKTLDGETDGSQVILTWTKSKNAKKYLVQVQQKSKTWKYWKSVKKTKANKKKFTVAKKYKVKASGKKYKVYRLKTVNQYNRVGRVTGTTFTYAGKYNTRYKFRVIAVNGATKAKPSGVLTIKTPEAGKVIKKKTTEKSGSNTDSGSSTDSKTTEKTETKKIVVTVKAPKHKVTIMSFGKVSYEFESPEGSVTNIEAGENDAWTLKEWKVISPTTLEIEDVHALKTSFKMPEEDVVIEACFQRKQD